MIISLHKNARTTPGIRKEIAESMETVAVLAKRYNTSEANIRKWQSRVECHDRSHTPHRLQTTLSEVQEAVVVELRKTLFLSPDDLLHILGSLYIRMCPALGLTAVSGATA